MDLIIKAIILVALAGIAGIAGSFFAGILIKELT